MSAPLLRGQVVWATLDPEVGRKPFVVVSNNARNRAMGSVLAARITTSRKPEHLPTVVRLRPSDPLVGVIVCDDLPTVFDDEVESVQGGLTRTTMAEVDEGLLEALGLGREAVPGQRTGE